MALSGLINIRLNPNLFTINDDLEKLADFIRACEQSGKYHIQFNIISGALLRNVMKEPEKHRDLLVRVPS